MSDLSDAFRVIYQKIHDLKESGDITYREWQAYRRRLYAIETEIGDGLAVEAAIKDPHLDDYCVVCGRPPELGGPAMHPVASIENGCVCEGCIE